MTQYNVFKSDSRVDGWKIQKKDKLLAITFSGTDAGRIRLYMSTLKVRPYIYIISCERTSLGNWVSRMRRNGVPMADDFLSFMVLLPPRGSFVIVKFSTSLKNSLETSLEVLEVYITWF